MSSFRDLAVFICEYGPDHGCHEADGVAAAGWESGWLVRGDRAAGAKIYITGQPQCDNPSHVCSLAGANGPQLTDSLAQRAGADPTRSVTYSAAAACVDADLTVRWLRA